MDKQEVAALQDDLRREADTLSRQEQTADVMAKHMTAWNKIDACSSALRREPILPHAVSAAVELGLIESDALHHVWSWFGNATIRECIRQRDWEAIAGVIHATSGLHGLPTFKPEWRHMLIDEARKDGVDLLALAPQR